MPRRLHDFHKDFVWSETNKTGKTITLYWADGTPHVIQPNERMVPPRQVEFLNACRTHREVFYGGALGGGKSYSGRAMLAERAIAYGKRGFKNVPVYLFCKTYPELRDRHIPRIEAWPAWLGRYKKNVHEFHFKKEFGGAVLKLRNLSEPTQYYSDEFPAAFIDEATHITGEVYTFIGSRIRWIRQPGDTAEEPEIFDTILASASNPGNTGHMFFKSRFVNPVDKMGMPNRDPRIAYIPAKMNDNPFFGEDYKQRLKSLGVGERVLQQWIDGSWESFDGQFFPQLEVGVHFISPFEIPSHWRRYRAMDHGGSRHPTVCLWLAVDPNGRMYVYREYSAVGATELHKRMITEFSRGEKYHGTVLDPSCKRNDLGSGTGRKTPWEVYNDPFDGLGSLNTVEAIRDRVTGWQSLQIAFEFEIDSEASERSQKVEFSHQPYIQIFNTCPNLWNSLTALTYKENSIEDAEKTEGQYAPGQGDDESEALQYGWIFAGKSPSQMETDRFDRAIGLPVQHPDRFKNVYEHGLKISTTKKRQILRGTNF